MRAIRSCWNSDRVAATVGARRSTRSGNRAVNRAPGLFAQYKSGSDAVEVFTRRGRLVYTHRFGDEIASACISGEKLEVETVNGGRYVCDAWSGKLLDGSVPAIVAAASPGRDAFPAHAGVAA